mgnify:FL=1
MLEFFTYQSVSGNAFNFDGKAVEFLVVGLEADFFKQGFHVFLTFARVGDVKSPAVDLEFAFRSVEV